MLAPPRARTIITDVLHRSLGRVDAEHATDDLIAALAANHYLIVGVTEVVACTRRRTP